MPVTKVEMYEIQDKQRLLAQLNEIVDAVNELERKVAYFNEQLSEFGILLSAVEENVHNLMKAPKDGGEPKTGSKPKK